VSAIRRPLGLGAWCAAIGGALWLLGHTGPALGAPPITHGLAATRAWAAGRDAPTIVMAGVRLCGLALGWYLLAATAVGVASRLSRYGPLIAATDAWTIPALRRLLAATAGSLLVALPAGVAPASASAPAAVQAVAAGPPAVQAVATGPPAAPPDDPPLLQPLPPQTAPTTSTPPSPPRPLAPAAAPAVATAGTTGGPPASTARSGPVMWTVRPGESFWSITTELLVSRLGRPPTDAEIVPVWHQLIELNRSRLRVPTDPGLIFEGQQLVISGV